MKAEDDKREPRPEGSTPVEAANRSDAEKPRAAPQPEGKRVEWTAEEHRLLAELESEKGGDVTEAIRRLVVGMLRQVRADPGEPPLDDPEEPKAT